METSSRWIWNVSWCDHARNAIPNELMAYHWSIEWTIPMLSGPPGWHFQEGQKGRWEYLGLKWSDLSEKVETWKPFSWSSESVQPTWTSQSFTDFDSSIMSPETVWWTAEVYQWKHKNDGSQWPGMKNDQSSLSSFEDHLRLPNVDHFWNPQGMPFGLCPPTAQGVPIPYYCSVNNWRVTTWVCQSGLDMTKLN